MDSVQKPPPPDLPEELEIVEDATAPMPHAAKISPPVGVVKCAFSLLLAMGIDALQVAFPPTWVVLDIVMLIALLMIWGRRWELAIVILPEIIPGVSVFPTWTLLVVYLMTRQVTGLKK